MSRDLIVQTLDKNFDQLVYNVLKLMGLYLKLDLHSEHYEIVFTAIDGHTDKHTSTPHVPHLSYV